MATLDITNDALTPKNAPNDLLTQKQIPDDVLAPKDDLPQKQIPNEDVIEDKKDYALEESEQEQANLSLETKKLILSLPKTKSWIIGHVYFFQGFWCKPQQIHAALRAQAHFSARDSDVVVATIPKSGTTWLKALVFAITQRARHQPARSNKAHPLLANNPHDLVPFLEYKVYAGPVVPDLDALPSPRLVASHVPYGSLPDSVKTSACKIVYICRNPLDTFVSTWLFIKKARQQIPNLEGEFTMEEAFDMYCKGEVNFGPFWDHMLGYWNESLRSPDKVMFLKYEDMKKDDGFMKIKKLANFLGHKFTAEEEKEGVVEEVAALCSFQTMKDLEVNKKGNSVGTAFQNESLFRKGEVGDYTNHLSKEMIEKLNKVTEEKLAGSGLEFMK
ncbi:hypothetical protein V2J09_000971 [Rumex salicifolius]